MILCSKNLTVGTTSDRAKMRQRIVAKCKNKANKGENENTRFNEVRQFAYILMAEGERVFIKTIKYRILSIQ